MGVQHGGGEGRKKRAPSTGWPHISAPDPLSVYWLYAWTEKGNEQLYPPGQVEPLRRVVFGPDL